MSRIKTFFFIISVIVLGLIMTSCSDDKANQDKNDKTSIIKEQNINNINQMAKKNNALIDWDSTLKNKTESFQPIFSLEVQNILQMHKQNAILFNELELKDIYKENNKTFVIFQSWYDELNLFFVLEANQSMENKLLEYNYDYLDSFSIIAKLVDVKRKNNMNIEALPIDENSADISIESGNTLILYGELLDTYKYSII